MQLVLAGIRKKSTIYLLHVYDGNERGESATTMFGQISVGGEFMWVGI